MVGFISSYNQNSGLRESVKLVENTKAFQSIDAKLGPSVYPGCEHVEFKSDAYWECFARSYSLTLFHPVNF